MSSAEAQARFLLALATRKFSDDQMRLLLDAHIEDGQDFAKLQHALADLTPQEAARIIAAIEADRALLNDGPLNLGQILGFDKPDGVHLPIEKRADEHGPS